jgi:hypothetical protein
MIRLKPKLNILVLFLVLFITVTACSSEPTEGEINTAIAETQAAIPTSTLEPTSTPEPTLTPTPDYSYDLGIYKDKLDALVLLTTFNAGTLNSLFSDALSDMSLWLDEDWIQEVGQYSSDASDLFGDVLTLTAPPPVEDLHIDLVEEALRCELVTAEIADEAASGDFPAVGETLNGGIFFDCALNFMEVYEAIEEAVEAYGTSTIAPEPVDTPKSTDVPVVIEQPAGAHAKVVVSNIIEHEDSRGTHIYIIGIIENLGGKDFSVRIDASLLDTQGSVLDSDHNNTHIIYLSQGDRSTFEIAFRRVEDEVSGYELALEVREWLHGVYQGVEIISSTGSIPEQIGYQITGDAMNAGDRELGGVTIAGAFFDIDGNLIGVSKGWAEAAMAPGASSPFTVRLVCPYLDVNDIDHYELFVQGD